MAPKTTSPAYTYPYPYRALFDAVLAVAPSIPITIEGADPATGTIRGATPMTLLKWGERISISVWEPQPGYAGISITSELKFGLADPFGMNQRNITRFFAALTPYADANLAPWRAPG